MVKRLNMSALRRMYVAGIWILSLMACGCEFWYLISGYMSYPTTTKMQITFPDEVRIPTVVACYTTDYTGDNITQFFEQEIKPSADPLTYMWFTRREKLNVLFWVLRGGRSRGSDQYMRVTSFAKGRMKCFAFHFFQKSLPRIYTSATFIAKLMVVRFNRNQNKCHSSLFYLLSPDADKPFLDKENELHNDCRFDIRKEGHTGYPDLTWRRSWSQLLEPPYDTNCRDYEKAGWQSRGHCYNECLRMQSIARMGLVTPDVQLFNASENQKKRLLSAEQRQKKSVLSVWTEICSKCSEKCSQSDCMSERFQPLNFASSAVTTNITISAYGLYMTSSPDVLIETKVGMTLIQLVVMLMNCISLWVALGPMDLSSISLKPIVRKFLHFRKKTWKILALVSKALWISICVTACLWQLYESSDAYFKYPTVSKVRIQTQATQAAPAFTCCHEYESKGLSNWSERFALAFPSNRFLLSSDSPFRSERFLRSSGGCTTIHPLVPDLQSGNPRNRLMYVIHMENLTRLITSCTLHDSRSRFHGGFDTIFNAILTPQSTGIVTWSQFRSERMSAPYDTHCGSYKDFESHDHCIEICVANRFVSETRQFPLRMSPVRENSYPQVKDLSISMNFTVAYKILEECIKGFCRFEDCVSNSYSPTYRRYSIVDRHAGGSVIWATTSSYLFSSSISVLASMDPVHVTQSMPAFNVVTFAVNFLATIAFWTGVCPLAVFMSSKTKHVVELILTRGLRGFPNNRFKTPSIKRFYTAIVLILVTLGYGYQVYITGSTYFAYKTTNQLQFQTQEQIKVPLMDMCFEPKAGATKELVRMSLTDVMAAVVTRYSYYTGSSIEHDHGLSSNTSLMFYQMFGMVCMSLSFPGYVVDVRRPGKTDYETTSTFWELFPSDKNMIAVVFFRRTLNLIKDPHLFITIHSDKYAYFDGESNFIDLKIHQKNGTFAMAEYLFMTYVEIEKHSLPHPYDTSCVHHQGKYSTSRDCFSDCYTSLFFQKYGSYPENAALALNQSTHFHQTRSPDPRQGDRLRNECRNRCHPDCRQTNYFLSITYSLSAPDCLLRLLRPSKAKTIITYTPVSALMDFVQLVMYGASFWLTFCPATILLNNRLMKMLRIVRTGGRPKPRIAWRRRRHGIRIHPIV